MKKLVLLVAVVLSVTTVMAQDISNTYELKGESISATLYHENGVIAQTGQYSKDNKLQGEWISFDSEGNKTAIAYYENGQKVGTWLFYQGDSIKEVTYTDSRIAEVKTWEVTNTQVVSNRK